jgi:hypothetical protein
MINRFRGKYAFLSNFYPCNGMAVKVNAEDFAPCATAEHVFQAMKCIGEKGKRFIARAETPKEARRRGRRVPIRSDWDDIKVHVMFTVLKAKFSDPSLARQLLATGSQSLIENNWWHDNFWGNCECPKCKTIKGENHLGKLLMQLRDEIRESLG